MELLAANTQRDHEVCTAIDVAGAYEAYNAAAAQARGEVLIFLNDDMFVPQGWDVPMVEATEPKCIVTGYVVEPGRHRVNHRNIQGNFGLDSVSFDRQAFQEFAAGFAEKVPPCEPGFGWYMPFAIRRTDFQAFPTTPETPNDVVQFGVYASRNYRFLRVNSVVYHLQKMSE